MWFIIGMLTGMAIAEQGTWTDPPPDDPVITYNSGDTTYAERLCPDLSKQGCDKEQHCIWQTDACVKRQHGSSSP